jgi:hypothetical protein
MEEELLYDGVKTSINLKTNQNRKRKQPKTGMIIIIKRLN